jgi:hypothetical protein
MSTDTETKKPRATPVGLGSAELVVADQTNWRRNLIASRIKFDDPSKAIYLAAIAEHGRKGDAAKAAGVSLQTVNNHLENDPDFLAAFEAARISYRDKVVSHAANLALEGIPRKRLDKEGNTIEEWREYPVRLVELELKFVEPEYREKQVLDVNAAGGVLVAPATVTPTEWAAAQAKANAEKRNPTIIDAEAVEVTEEPKNAETP